MLLDAAMEPRTAWRFEAVMVLLSGHWPPRGLLSGGALYPPLYPPLVHNFPTSFEACRIVYTVWVLSEALLCDTA